MHVGNPGRSVGLIETVSFRSSRLGFTFRPALMLVERGSRFVGCPFIERCQLDHFQ
jgi:hypothetical protein